MRRIVGADRGRTGTAGGVAGPTSDVTASAALAGLPPDHYVVVHETTAPHDTLATALELPDVPYFGVIGTLGPGNPIDLYRLTVSVGEGRLDFVLLTSQSASAIPTDFGLFDGSGQLPGQWSVGD
jgi:hypothetical protein